MSLPFSSVRPLILVSALGLTACGHLAPEHGHATPPHAPASHAAPHAAAQGVEAQRLQLAQSTEGKGFGPQSPRDIDSREGSNNRRFAEAPEIQEMNLCNIHFHRNAEHKGGEFTRYAGDGDGHGYGSGYQYSGGLTVAEARPVEEKICPSAHGDLVPGDTIEVHYVHSTAEVAPGKGLGSCLNDAAKNPQLRVEAQVFVLVNDAQAYDFRQLVQTGMANGKHQATGMLQNTGRPVRYAGSTTGPSYNVEGSPFEVTWAVRPKVAKVNIATVGEWCKGNAFEEDHAHGVRNLVVNPKLLSPIQ